MLNLLGIVMVVELKRSLCPSVTRRCSPSSNRNENHRGLADSERGDACVLEVVDGDDAVAVIIVNGPLRTRGSRVVAGTPLDDPPRIPRQGAGRGATTPTQDDAGRADPGGDEQGDSGVPPPSPPRPLACFLDQRLERLDIGQLYDRFSSMQHAHRTGCQARSLANRARVRWWLPSAFITIASAFHAKATFAPSGDQMGRVQIPTQQDPR